jgi:tetratricopeptide (TPR) repeat protein
VSIAETDLGRLEPALQAVRRAAARAQELDAPLLRASALGQAAWVLDQMGKRTEAQSTAEAALAIHDKVGHPSERADTLNVLANILIDPREAIALYEQTLAIALDIGSREGEAIALNNLAVRLGDLGDLGRQKEMYEQSLALTEESGNKLDYAITLSNLAANCIFRGDWETGGRYQEQALSMAREQGARGLEAGFMFMLGARRMIQARLTEARDLIEESRRIQIELGAGESTSGEIRFLGWIDFLEDRPDRARERLEEALAIVERQGYPGSGVRNFLATIELDEGRPDRAEKLARQTRESALGPGATHNASSLLARALADQGRDGETEEHLREALEGIRGSQNFIHRTVVGLNAAKVDLALGRPDDARGRLETIREETAAVGWIVVEMESRLLLARLGHGPGDTIADRAVLKAVEEDARSHGLLRIARLAAEAADWEN